MAKPLNSQGPGFRQDLIKFACFLVAVIGTALLFFGTPALTLPTLTAIVAVTLLSPWVTQLERRGLSRGLSILLVCVGLAGTCFVAGMLAAKNWQNEWLSFQEKAPEYFASAIRRTSAYEATLRTRYPLFHNFNLAESLSRWGESTGTWFVAKISEFMGNLLGLLFLAPIITFCLLSEGRTIRKKFFQLVPNRFFESIYTVTHGVTTALSDYLRAKLIEAFLVGGLTAIGLALIHSPYAIVLGVWAGITNILPYIGPPLGAIPAVLIAALDSQSGSASLWGTVAVYGVANLIDSVLIFPAVVASLVKLNPLVLIASVVLGQYYYGIVGMLISIPIAAAIKVILSEVYVIIYGFAHD